MTRFTTTLLLACAPLVAAAQTGSGTVSFDFNLFSGPMAHSLEVDKDNPANWSGSPGLVNGERPTSTGVWVPQRAPDWWQPPPAGWVLGMAPLSGASVTMVYELGGRPNVVSFAPAAFADVAVGERFKLATLSFTNGMWFGGGETTDYNAPSRLDFSLSTTSPDGDAFNQTLTGSIVMVTNGPYPYDHESLEGMQAEADWVHFVASGGGSVDADMGAFRVFDYPGASPPGYTGSGSVEVYGRFGSLDLVAFANPDGGFVTPGNVDPLPVPQPPIPEPGVWALLLLGLGVVAGAARRRAQP